MPLPKENQLDGDRAFVRVNMRQHPALLEDGEVSYGRNLRFDDGKAATRKGVRIMRWAQPAAPSGAPRTPSVEPRSYGQVRAAAVYNEPIMGKEWLLVATNAKVWRSRPGQSGVEVPVPAATEIPVGAQFIQTYNGMVLVGGRYFAPLYMEDLDEGFKPIPAIPPPKPGDAYVEPLPPCYSGIYCQNRFFGVDARPELDKVDSVWVSDFGGVTSVLQGSSSYQNFKINQGSADRLTCLFKLNDTTIITAKTGSVHVVSGVYGDNLALAQNARLDAITDEYGCSAPRSFVLVGQDAWFLADRRGVAGVRKTGLGLVQEVDIPRSRDLEPLIPRINWQAVQGSTATAWGNYVYFAVPLDGATYNNAVLVYSILNQGWCGFDDGPAIDVLAWVKFTYGGEKRLGFVSSSGFICVYEDGRADEVGSVVEGVDAITRVEIQGELVTRGYGGRLPGVKQFGTLGGKVATLDPEYQVLLRHDGVNEEFLRATVTKDRTRYYRPVGAPLYDEDEWDATKPVGQQQKDEFLKPYREDYSLYWPIAPDYPVGLYWPPSGVALELMQEVEESWDFRHRGQYLQAVLRSTRGHLSVGGLMVDYRFARGRRGAWA